MDTQDSRLDYRGADEAEDILRWTLETFHPSVALACSFSAEDIALAHMMMGIRDDAQVFAIDTGRLNEETYECAEAVRRQLGVSIKWYFPSSNAVELLERGKGLFSFRESLDNRHECCRIRKVDPLTRALSGLDAWITGQRREQNVTRSGLSAVERDAAHGEIVKLNPLLTWDSDAVWRYVRDHKLPYNRLHDTGYPSIGCAPCTRAITTGEHPRAGRWWWEEPAHKECGLHVEKTRTQGG